MATLKTFLGMGFFKIKMGHLARHCVILPFYSNNLSLNGSTCYPCLLGMLSPKCYCICRLFPIDDHPILLDVVAHIETNIFPFQLTL